MSILDLILYALAAVWHEVKAFSLYPNREEDFPEMRKESHFQAKLIKELRNSLDGCLVLKNDGSNVPQGFPDLLILFKDQWASLECKREEEAHRQPNQEYYVDLLNKMSFSRFISPENKDEVLNELYSTFGLDR